LRRTSQRRGGNGVKPRARKAKILEGKELAPQVGLEPTTLRLTAECSTIELLRSGPAVVFAITADTLRCCQMLSRGRAAAYFRLLRYARMSPTSCALSVCHEVFFATILDNIPAPCSHIPATIQYAEAPPPSLAKLGAPLY
jgi:hypothetical protein